VKWTPCQGQWRDPWHTESARTSRRRIFLAIPFRGDLPKIDIPVLAIHGTADRVLPPPVTVERLRNERLIADLTVVEIPDGPHNVCWTHPDEVNSALLSFLCRPAGDTDAEMAMAGG
jgi:pimeloyl-ACP methyl ester carboxylesterase